MPLPLLFWPLLTVLIGPVIGSFMAVVSMRLPAGRPVALARSTCDGCQRTLEPLELVPIVSFLALKGRCATCGASIAWQHLGFELAGFAIGVWAAAHAGPAAMITAVLGWQLLLLAALDAEHLWLPRVLTAPLIISGLLVAAVEGKEALLSRLIGAAVGFAALWAVAALYRRLRGREGLGGGDAWLMAGAGAWVGGSNLPIVLLIASVGGLIYALAPLAFGRPVKLDRQLPFGTFLAAGIWLTYVVL